MARKLSRRELARYAARQLAEGAPVKKIATQLAAYLIEHRRTGEMNIILRDIAAYLPEHGYVTGTLTSAHELNAATLKAIKVYAKEHTGAAHVSLDTVVDEAVLGGIRLELPGRELDTTIARSLTILKTRYKKA